MNAIDQVRRAFRSKYSFDLPLTWLQACVSWLRDQYQLADLTNSYTLERIQEQWLHTDLSLIGDTQSLPNDFDVNAKKIELTGKYLFQINSILCITEPYYTQVLSMHGDLNENERIDTDITETQQWKPPPTKRVLYLNLTDGKFLLRGLEYETISGLDRDHTLPGTKVLVTGPVTFRRGILLLTGKNTQILGGYVEELLNQNHSMETALSSLSKTASKISESRSRFDRLNIKLHLSASIARDETPNLVPPTRSNPSTFYEDEDEMDTFIRQAYADGIIDDESEIAPSLSRKPSPPRRTSPLRRPSPPRRTSPLRRLSPQRKESPKPPPKQSQQTANPHPFQNTDKPQEVLFIPDDDDHNFQTDEFFEMLSASIEPDPLPPPLPMIKVSMPYTYLSIAASQKVPSSKTYQDHRIKACFSSLTKNPHLVRNEYDLEAFINDGSDCLLVRLASDFLAQRIGITASELLIRRRQCQTDSDKQRLQADFNERLKRLSYQMGHLYSVMTVRFFSDNQKPMVISVDET